MYIYIYIGARYYYKPKGQPSFHSQFLFLTESQWCQDNDLGSDLLDLGTIWGLFWEPLGIKINTFLNLFYDRLSSMVLDLLLGRFVNDF
jgi:hypothetical protein